MQRDSLEDYGYSYTTAVKYFAANPVKAILRILLRYFFMTAFVASVGFAVGFSLFYLVLTSAEIFQNGFGVLNGPEPENIRVYAVSGGTFFGVVFFLFHQGIVFNEKQEFICKALNTD